MGGWQSVLRAKYKSFKRVEEMAPRKKSLIIKIMLRRKAKLDCGSLNQPTINPGDMFSHIGWVLENLTIGWED